MARYRSNRRGATGWSPGYEAGWESAFGKGKGKRKRKAKRRGTTKRARRAARRAHKDYTGAVKREHAMVRVGKTKRTKKRYGRGQYPQQKRARRREGVYRSLVAKGVGKQAAARRAMRAVPFGKSRRGDKYRGMTVYTGKAQKRAGRTMPAQYRVQKITQTRKVRRRVKVRRKVRVAYGRYRRVRLTDPRTGRRTLSYMYRDKRGRLRKIPLRAILTRGERGKKGYAAVSQAAQLERRRTRVSRKRDSASRRVLRAGGPFVPNRRKSMARKKKKRSRSAKRRSAAKKGWRTRRAKRAARRASARRRGGRRTVGRGRGRRGVYLKRGKVYYRGRKPRGLGRRGRRLPKARLYITNKKRRRRRRKNRGAAANRGAAMTPNRRRRRRRRNARAATPNRRRRRRKNRGYAPNGRHLRRARRKGRRGSYRRNGRRSYRRNQFLSQMKQIAISATFVFVGFVAQKAITKLVGDKLLLPMLQSKAEKAAQENAASQGVGQEENELDKQKRRDSMKKFVPIMAGFPIMLVNVFIATKLPKYRVEVGGGVVASFFHTVLVTLLESSKSEKTRAGVKWIAGVGRTATVLQVAGSRAVYGMGQAPRSILPRYFSLENGGMQQAVAGGRRGAGEYFKPLSGASVGEYIASGVQGIGQYEEAGPMVTQAAAGVGQVIDEGIRPDSNLDEWLSLAEAQAGVGKVRGLLGPRGMGEYFAARRTNGGSEEYSVPGLNTWIPGGPLWAGTASAGDSVESSEVPAGILETPGGNGIFG